MRAFAAILGIMSVSLTAQANEVSPLVSKLFGSGIKNFSCEISGREILDTSAGWKGLAKTRQLRPRAILASSEEEATKLCLIKVNANLGYGPLKEGSGVHFVVLISDIPELKTSKHNLFVADEIKVRELKLF